MTELYPQNSEFKDLEIHSNIRTDQLTVSELKLFLWWQ